MSIAGAYFRSLYRRTMETAYATAYDAIVAAATHDAVVLDCGAHDGAAFDTLAARCKLTADRFRGIEWDATAVAQARARRLDVVQGDLNRPLPYADGAFGCVYALSVLEHLLQPCRFLAECHRVLRPGGSLVLLTPNISTYFTAAQILLGRMPSSGPHPDSDRLVRSEEMFQVRGDELQHATEGDTPVHRHLVVFSFRVLRRYLGMLEFRDVRGRGFGVYPFPNFMQPLVERIDPYHSHQMVFVATK